MKYLPIILLLLLAVPVGAEIDLTGAEAPTDEERQEGVEILQT